MKKKMTVSGLFILITGLTGNLAAQDLHKVTAYNLEQLQEYFSYDPDQPIIVSGHRGGMMPGFPENSIEAFEKTLTLMPSFFEIDPQLTKDSVLVLMHDETIDRTTNGSGPVSEYTYQELRQFNLKDRNGKVTPYKIPTLAKALEWGRDKTIFNLDNKGVPWELYADLINNLGYTNLILSVDTLEEALFYYERNDNVMFCVGIKNMEDYRTYENSKIPWDRIMAYAGYTMDPEQNEVYSLLHEQGVSTMIAVAPTRDQEESKQAKKEGYRKEIAKKPDIIETDYPSLFLDLPLTK